MENSNSFNNPPKHVPSFTQDVVPFYDHISDKSVLLYDILVQDVVDGLEKLTYFGAEELFKKFSDMSDNSLISLLSLVNNMSSFELVDLEYFLSDDHLHYKVKSSTFSSIVDSLTVEDLNLLVSNRELCRKLVVGSSFLSKLCFSVAAALRFISMKDLSKLPQLMREQGMFLN